MCNILYIITELNVGGAETMLYELVTRLDRQLFNITVLSLQNKGYFGMKLEEFGIEVITLNMKNKWDILKLFKMHSIFKKRKYAIIHSFMFHANMVARIAAKLYRIPINISAVHTIEKGALWHLFIDKLTRPLVTKETVICKAAQEFMISKTHIEHDKVMVIHNAVDVSKFNQTVNTDEIKNKYTLPLNKKIVGTVGSLTKVKGHINLIHAASHIIEIIPNTIFVIIGKGPYKENLINEVKKYTLEKHFHFLGFITPIYEILPILDCFVLSSLWEGVPIAILEAMAAKKPIVTIDAGGINEIIVNGKSGIIIPFMDERKLADAVIKVLEDSQLSRQMGENGYKTVSKHYTFKSMVEKTMSLYSELLKCT